MLEKQKRHDLVAKWNTKVACHMPSKSRIRAYKKQQQKERQYQRQIIEEEKRMLDLMVDQATEVRAELDGLANTPNDTGG